jgi:hypothetical protein
MTQCVQERLRQRMAKWGSHFAVLNLRLWPFPEVAQRKIEHTIPIRFPLDKTMDVGEDTGAPVVEEYLAKMPFMFTGDLKKVAIELGRSGLRTSDAKEMQTGDERAAGVAD